MRINIVYMPGEWDQMHEWGVIYKRIHIFGIHTPFCRRRLAT